MITKSIILNGERVPFKAKVSNEFGNAIQNYNFKDMKEVNKILQCDARCRDKGLFSWCPADTENLKKYLGIN